MSGAIYPLPQYAIMAWCLVKARGYCCVEEQPDNGQATLPYLKGQTRRELSFKKNQISRTLYLLYN
jgi:hypothetical protein